MSQSRVNLEQMARTERPARHRISARGTGTVKAARSRDGKTVRYQALLPRSLSDGRHTKRPQGYRQPVGETYATAEEARAFLDLELARLVGLRTADARWACPNKPGVYAIRGAGGFIKIGRASKSVAERVKHLQTTHPIRLQFLALLSDDPSDEYSIHDRFREFHLNGEWFRPGKPLLDFIRERQAGAT